MRSGCGKLRKKQEKCGVHEFDFRKKRSQPPFSRIACAAESANVSELFTPVARHKPAHKSENSSGKIAQHFFCKDM